MTIPARSDARIRSFAEATDNPELVGDPQQKADAMDIETIIRRFEIERLYADYAHCLDADQLEDWPDFFTEECFYRVTSAENFEAGLPLGLIYATSRNMLKDRVSALREANIYEPQRYRHLVSSLRVVGEDPGGLDAEANFLVVRTMQDGEMTIFAAGRYVDRVVPDDVNWKFARKEVVLDSRQIDTLLAIPI